MNDVFRTQTRLDWDAAWTFTLSVLALLLSAGISLLLALTHVVQSARVAVEHPESADMILVFGKKLQRQKPDREYVGRLLKAAQILRSFPQASVILMGGSVKEGEISEAEAGRLYLSRLGIPDTVRISLEQKSRHTLDNLRNARDDLVGLEVREGRSAVLVSNRYHLARCSLIADSLGMQHTICGAEKTFRCNLTCMRNLLAEAFFVHWFKIGRYWAILTGNRRMLSRIT